MADGPLSTQAHDPDPTPAALRAERDAWAQELFESNRYAAELAIARQALADALATAEARAQAQADAAAAHAIDLAWQARDAALAERDRALAEAFEAQALLRRVRSSTSWRMTAPIRAVLGAVLGRPRGGA